MLNEMLRETKFLSLSRKSQFSSVKKILCFILITIGLTTFTNAQGITNTLGGNTYAEKFIVENSDSEAGLIVTGEGNVGIGNTEPSAELHLKGNSEIIRMESTSLDNGYLSIFNSDGYKGYLGSWTGADDIDVGTGSSNTTGKLHLVTQANPRMTIDSDGKVGIGATSTGSKLYIEDSQSAGSNTPILTINNTAPSGQNMLDFQHNGTTQGRLRSAGGGSFSIENIGNSDIRMITNDEVRMTIKNDGKVGIWTTSPSQMLEVNGKIKIGTDGSTPTAGTIRFLNGHFEGYDGSTWKQLDN